MSDRGGKSATIGAGAYVVGRIAGDEDLSVQGRVEGEIDLRGALRVESGATVRANVHATAVWIGGVVVGDVLADDVLHVAHGAKVIGDLRAARLVIEPGAQVSGAVAVESVPRVSDGPRRSFSQPR